MKGLKIKKFAVIIIGIIITVFIISFVYFEYRPDRPNVLLITVDALRPDHLGCYGYERNTSPNIDKLAREGVMFTQAISQGSQTVPSIPSLMTSLYPSQHGIKSLQFDYVISHPVLAQILKENGYSTGCILAHELSHAGLGKGFDLVDMDFNKKADLLTQKAVDWLRQNKNGNFFLWVHYLDPHGPYQPPSPYNRLYCDDEFYKKNRNIPIASNTKDIYNSDGTIPLYVAENDITEVDYYIAQYDGEISFTDEQIGILLKELEELGLDRKTIVILTADHGEGMGEHNIYFTHGGSLYDELLKVPLIIKYKKAFPAGKIINQQVSLIDILPTLLAVLKIERKLNISGVNLMPLFSKGADFSTRVVISEDFDLTETDKGWVSRSLRTAKWKLICNSDNDMAEFELYNLEKDPHELLNVRITETEKLNFFKRELDNYTKQNLSKATKPIGIIDKDIQEKLRSLGYLQ